ncbi:MAG: ATP-grasp fold amidoligase family protein, partial [Planctomycetota bacterium]
RPQQPRHPAWVGVLGILGLVLILSSAYFLRRLDLTMSWPVVGAVLVLACGHSGPCHWLLTRPPLVHLGKLSYSLYLWHWPILVFAEPYCNAWSKGWLIVPIYLCAWLSFHGIEQTTRWRSGIVPSILATAGVLGIAGALLTFAGRAYDTSRFDEPSSSALSFDLNPDRISSSSHRRNLPNFYIGFKTFPSLASLTAYREDGIVLGDESKPIQVMVIGDSHGLMWSQTVRQIVERHHLRASFCSIGGVAPPWNLHPTSRQSRILSGNMRFEFDRRRLENLARWRPDVVILSTPWDRQTEQNVAALIGYCQEHSRRVLLLEQPPRLAEIGDRNALQYACFRGLVPQPGQKQFWPVMDRAPRGFHQLLDRVLLRSSETPIEKWHCCSLRQRSLLNKWNSREFAKLCGVPVPELYWSGRWASKLPLDQMPEYFVIRPAWGAGSKGTYVVSGTKNLINNECYPDRPALKQAVLREHGQWQLFPLLAEEFLLNQHGEPESGIEFKFLMFGQHVGAIMTFRRVGDKKFVRYYTDQWEPIERPFHFSVGLDEVISCPDNFTDMTEIATRLATAFGTFVRVDLYNTSKGIYFGEFSSVPGGRGRHTDFANEFLGRAWQTYMPEMI